MGADDGPVSVPGSTTRDDCHGTGRIATELCGVGDEREDLCREAAGTSRQDLGGQQRPRNDPSGCEGQPEPRPGPVGGDCGIPTSGSEVQGKVEAKGGSIYKVDGGKDNSFDYDAIDRIYKEPEYDTTKKPSNGRDCGGCGDRSGRDRGGDGGGSKQSCVDASSVQDERWGMKSMWQALMGLRTRMSAGTSMDRPMEADPNPSTTQLGTVQHATSKPRTTTTTSTTNDILAVQNCCTKQVMPTLARRLAKAATLATLVLHPMKELVKEFEAKYDLVEIACAPASTLTETFLQDGLRCLRVNHLTGYDLDTRKGTQRLEETLRSSTVGLAWVAMPCTRLSALQNLTPRDEFQMARFLKKRGQDLRRSEEVVDGLEHILLGGGDLAWKWPTTAVAGWKSRAMRKLEKLVKKHNRVLYWIRIELMDVNTESCGRASTSRSSGR